MGRRGKLLDLTLFGKSGLPPRTPPSPTRQKLTNYQDNQHLLAGLQPLKEKWPYAGFAEQSISA
jgi:hypothetical protein